MLPLFAYMKRGGPAVLTSLSIVPLFHPSTKTTTASKVGAVLRATLSFVLFNPALNPIFHPDVPTTDIKKASFMVAMKAGTRKLWEALHASEITAAKARPTKVPEPEVGAVVTFPTGDLATVDAATGPDLGCTTTGYVRLADVEVLSSDVGVKTKIWRRWTFGKWSGTRDVDEVGFTSGCRKDIGTPNRWQRVPVSPYEGSCESDCRAHGPVTRARPASTTRRRCVHHATQLRAPRPLPTPQTMTPSR